MPNLNKVILIGHMTKDAETRTLPSGGAVADFSIAVNSGTKDRQETYFADCVVFGKQAENLTKYTAKGSCLLVEGRLRMDQWEDKQTGEKRQKTRIIAERVQFMDSRERRESNQGEEQTGQNQTRQPNASGHKYDKEDTQPQMPELPPEDEITDDDIPF